MSLERISITIPKDVLEAADRRAAELDRSRKPSCPTGGVQITANPRPLPAVLARENLMQLLDPDHANRIAAPGAILYEVCPRHTRHASIVVDSCPFSSVHRDSHDTCTVVAPTRLNRHIRSLTIPHPDSTFYGVAGTTAATS